MIKNFKNKEILFFFTKDKFKNFVFLFFIFISFFSFFNLITTNLVSQNSSEEIKEQFYNDYVFDVASNLIDNRSIEGFEGGNSRHKLRWLYRYTESKVYETIFKITKNKPLMIYSLINTFYIFFAFFFSFLSISGLRKSLESKDLILSSLFFFSLICIIFSYGYQTIYSLPELLFISMGIYYSLNSRIVLFLLVMFLAVVNRESGIAVSLIYIILNHRKLYTYILPFVAITFLLIVNFDLVQNINIYKFSTYFPINENYFEKQQESLKQIIVFFIFILSFSSMMFSFIRFSDPILNKLLLIFFLYTFIALFGTNLTNIFSLILTIPSFTILFVFFYDNLNK